MKFQQFTGPLMAKGSEDTILYIYNRLISLNEVGGDPFALGCLAGASIISSTDVPRICLIP